MFASSISEFFYKRIAKPYFFSRDPENVHDQMTRLGRELGEYGISRALTSTLFRYENEMLEQTVRGIHFRNPIGLSAGFDKNAHLVSILKAVGFGFTQVGSVTAQSYDGNPGKRLHRLKESKGLVVYYGLKNDGIDAIIKRIKESYLPPAFPISISIAKTNSEATAQTEAAVADYFRTYQKCLQQNIGDFFTLNISCPNTFGGEPFTTPQKLRFLLDQIRYIPKTKPIFIKMPLEMKWEDYEQLIKIAIEFEIDGVILSNLVKMRQDNKFILDPIDDSIKGGISGRPTKELVNKLIFRTYKNYGNKLTIIGVGGVATAQDAYEKIKLGASLVQTITGMVYGGPQRIGQINKGLVEMLKNDGYKNVSEAIGAYA